MKRAWCLVIVSIIWLAPFSSAIGQKTPQAELEQAIELYYQNDYKRALPIIDELLKKPDLPVAMRIESLKYQAIILYLLSLYGQARASWLVLLSIKPDIEISSRDFSPELIAFFQRITVPEKKQEPKAADAKPAVATTVAEKPTADGNTGVTLIAPKKISGGAVVVRLLPFGIGQFANHKVAKGVLFLALDALFLGLNIGLYYSWRLPYEKSGYIADRDDARNRMVAQNVFFGLLITTAFTGIIEGLVGAKKTREATP
jgi:hypothetical protein